MVLLDKCTSVLLDWANVCLCFQYCGWVLWTANQILRILSACKFHQPLVSVTYIISSLEQCKLVGRCKSKTFNCYTWKVIQFWKAQYFIIMSHKHYFKPTKVPFSMPKRVLRLTEVLFRLPATRVQSWPVIHWHTDNF